MILSDEMIDSRLKEHRAWQERDDYLVRCLMEEQGAKWLKKNRLVSVRGAGKTLDNASGESVPVK